MNDICMIAYSNMPWDVRIKREAEALIEKGFNLDIICLKGEKETSFENCNGMNIYRLDLKKEKGSMWTYLIGYNKFIFYSMIKLLNLNKAKKYSYVHIHNPPDNLIFAALPLKLIQDTQIILDIHDPMPEIFASRFGKSMDSFIVKMMKSSEFLCCKLADRIITVNDTIKNNFNKKGFSNVFVVMNSPDEKLFNEEKGKTSKKELGLDGKYVVLYEGSIMKRRGIHVLVDAIDLVKNDIPNICCLIVGDGEYLNSIREKVNMLKLEKKVLLTGKRPVDEMPEYIAVSDICVIPFTDTPINNLGAPNKLFEYMVYNKQIIVPKLRAMSELLSNNECFFFEPENSHDLAKKILEIHNLAQNFEPSFCKYTRVYEKCKWDVMKQRLYECYINR